MVKPPTRLTKGHLKLHDFIVYLGFDVEDEVFFDPYTVDIYVPELHMAFEFDGELHKQSANKRRDIERDAFLWETYHLPVCRVDDELLKDTINVQAYLITFMTDPLYSNPEKRKEGINWLTTT